jgi:hypothetical protein
VGGSTYIRIIAASKILFLLPRKAAMLAFIFVMASGFSEDTSLVNLGTTVQWNSAITNKSPQQKMMHKS